MLKLPAFLNRYMEALQSDLDRKPILSCRVEKELIEVYALPEDLKSLFLEALIKQIKKL